MGAVDEYETTGAIGAQAIESLESAARHIATELRIALAPEALVENAAPIRELKILIEKQGRGAAKVRVVVPVAGSNGTPDQEAEILLRAGVALSPAAIAGSRTPSIIAVKVFLVNPSARSGRRPST